MGIALLNDQALCVSWVGDNEGLWYVARWSWDWDGLEHTVNYQNHCVVIIEYIPTCWWLLLNEVSTVRGLDLCASWRLEIVRVEDEGNGIEEKVCEITKKPNHTFGIAYMVRSIHHSVKLANFYNNWPIDRQIVKWLKIGQFDW